MTLDALPAYAGPMLARPVLQKVARHWNQGRLIVDLPDRANALRFGEPGSGPEARWSVRRWRALRRVLSRGDLGFAAGYLAGDWDTADLGALLTAIAANYDHLGERVRGIKVLQLGGALAHALNRNNRAGSRRNILAHYDLGNTFYAAWLDASMTYSSALFEDPAEPLEVAQRRKYQTLAREVGIGPGDCVLELGCGWGGFAEYAAGELGATVTAITLSPAQKAYAEERLFKAGLAERVSVQLLDYRDVAGTFDAAVSIEMFEAVGRAYWPVYFNHLARALKPGGRAGLQVITLRDDLFEDYQRRPDFIQLEVFPGGMTPTNAHLAKEAEAVGLATDPAKWHRFGTDYARTLRLWRERFERRWPEIEQLGFDDRFRRLWRYYLAYCEAGFETGRTDVVQAVFRR